MNDQSMQESEREEVLLLQELPEHGGAAQPRIFDLTSFVSIFSDCSGILGTTGDF